MLENRGFTGVFIPKRIWVNTELSPVQKMLLAEIEVLSEDTGYCYASNSHFAKWLDCSPQNVSNHIRRFQEMNAICVTFENENTGEGRKIYVKKEFYYGKDPVTTSLPPLTPGLGGLTTGLTDIQYIDNNNSVGVPSESGKTSFVVTLIEAADIEPEYTFEEFWSDYGYKKGSKANAERKFNKTTQKERDAIKETLPLYKSDTVTSDTGRANGFKPMRKHPEFYLSGKLWENYMDVLAERKKENEAFPEFDEMYKKYLDLVKELYPEVLRHTKQMSKKQYVSYKRDFYVKGKSYIDEKTENEIMKSAHRQVNENPENYTDVFSHHCTLIEKKLKSYQI